MFRKKKKAQEYYEDYDYDYDYDNGYYYDEDDDYEEGHDSSSASSPTDSSKKGFGFENELNGKDQEIIRLQTQLDKMTLQFNSVQALPSHYQQLETNYETSKEKIEEMRRDNVELVTKLKIAKESSERAEVNTRQFQKEINTKQIEIDQLTDEILNLQAHSSNNEDFEKVKIELEERNTFIQNQFAETEKEKIKLRAQIDELTARVASAEEDNISKEDIAEVLLEAKSKARQIVDQANYDSRRIVSDAERDLKNVSQDARTLYHRISMTKEDSEMIFGELLRKLTVLSDIDSTQHEEE